MADARDVPFRHSLAARLLGLIIGFVLIAEALIYAPALGDFWRDCLEDRLAAGYLAALSLQAAPDNMVGPELTAELLAHAGVEAVRVRGPEGGEMVLARGPVAPGRTIDPGGVGLLTLFLDSWHTLLAMPMGQLAITGPVMGAPGRTVTVVVAEDALVAGLTRAAWQIFALSILVSLVTAALIYGALMMVLVRPMCRLADAMVAFRDDPRNPRRRLRAGRRRDEIGAAERALAHMQADVGAALDEHARLADLGAASARIHHDLRNMLATASLAGEALENDDDPAVRRQGTRLMTTLDRAVRLCGEILRYATETPPAPGRAPVDLAALAAAAGDGCDAPAVVPPDRPVMVAADRDQAFRILVNLIGNAAEAGATTVTLDARVRDGQVDCDIVDDGPGIPDHLRERLFKPFVGTSKVGGGGLGLAIARELARAHGGDLALVASDAAGTRFRLSLPAAGTEAA